MLNDQPPTALENLSIAVACVALGLMAGFFGTYTFNVNRATLQVDGATYAVVQSLFNRNVRHAGFFILFFGGGLLPTLALLVNYRHWKSSSFWLVALSAVVYTLGVIVFTRQVNLPLNAYTESWNPAQLPPDWMVTRDAWNTANAVRVWFSLSAFISCLLALALRGPTSVSRNR